MQFRGWQRVSLMDYPGKIATTAFVGGCNFRCPYCHNWELVENGSNLEAISSDEVLAFLKKRSAMVDGICISGGEPTIHKELPEFARRVKGMGKLVKLDTNGANPDMIRELLDGKWLDFVAMDVKCTMERYCALTKCSADELPKLKESIEMIKKSGIDYEFRTTITREYNPSSDKEALAHLVSGAKSYALQKFRIPEGHFDENLSPLSKIEAEEIMEAVRPHVGEINLRGY
ncbi:MAG: anaerobic ribonucleoside-triphosphate reductase activating protein [Peptostreptococcaceae bacterium]|nr:anaerobic ribonucleoside-triphosphate reductase activating protein [Peptostreptococcaceae bacterium]